MYFSDIKNNKNIYLYAGDCVNNKTNIPFIGLSLGYNNNTNINHNVLDKMDLDTQIVSK